MTTQPGAPPRAAMILGAAGLAPFAAGALGAILGDGEVADIAQDGLTLYGAIILSFMGGCRWGFRGAGLGDHLGDPAADARAYGVAVAPALWAFFTLLIDRAIGFGGAGLFLAAGFVVLYLSDRAAARSGAAPPWWTALRAPLTAGAVAALAAPAVLAL